MSDSLYNQLRRIGIDEELAARVNASLDPEYNASKKDVLVMQEAIMQVQLRSDARYHEQNNKIDSNYHELNAKIDSSVHGLNTKIDSSVHELNAKIDSSAHELNTKIEGVKAEMRQGFAEMRSDMATNMASIKSDMASMNRQYLITFGGLITTILAVFLVNLYFHL